MLSCVLPTALRCFRSARLGAPLVRKAPACHECNSTYKLGRDPARNAAGRRKAFYPYPINAHADLLDWLATTREHLLVASCGFHYQCEFIHPFADGNGRIGRLWQTLILRNWQPLLAYLPVETVIHDRHEDYYRVLAVPISRPMPLHL